MVKFGVSDRFEIEHGAELLDQAQRQVCGGSDLAGPATLRSFTRHHARIPKVEVRIALALPEDWELTFP